MGDVQWIRIATGIFDNRKIRQIEYMPEGDAIIVIWLKLLILAAETNDDGLIYLTRQIPYTENLLANRFGKPAALVHLAMSTFVSFEMIEIENDIIQILNWEKYQNIDGLDRVREQTRIRTRAWRERKALCDVTVASPVTECDSDVTEQNKNKNKNKNISSLSPDEEPKKPPLEPQLRKRFDVFWEAYPKKVSKPDAERAWKKLKPDGDLTDEILKGLERAKHLDRRFRDSQYIPYPATWLNSRGWEDEFPEDVPTRKESSFEEDEFFNAACKRTK